MPPTPDYEPGPPPKEALEYFRQKGLAVGFDYRDVWRQEHAVAFTVAKAMQVDVLESIRGALDKTLAEGRTIRDFAKDLRPELERLGWWGRKDMRDPKTGETREVQLGSPRRLKTIYTANMRTARATGQWERAQRVKRTRPYFVYELGPSENHRAEHVQWAGLILPVDDPWWDDHYPPNGWGCKCRVRQITRTEAEQLGKNGVPDSRAPQIEDDDNTPTGHRESRTLPAKTEAPPATTRNWPNSRTGQTERVPTGIDPGWNVNPGKNRYKAFTPPPAGGLPTSFPPGTDKPDLPSPRAMPKSRLLPDDLPAQDYVATFLRELGATPDKPAVHIDPIGQPLIISADLFRGADGSWKIEKGARRERVLLLADALKDPDEIWWTWEPSRTRPGEHVLRRRYVARYQVEGESVPGLAVFDWHEGGWRGATIFSPEAKKQARQDKYIDGVRQGLLAYRRK